jgi:mono/diheme cytochrome c family protein
MKSVWLSNLVTVSVCAAALNMFVPVAVSSPLPAQLEAGERIYTRQCAACHGERGDGNGPATVWLYPKPRDFSAGLFKIKSTPGTALPTARDLFETVTRGMPGSSMPSYDFLSEEERWEVVRYIQYLTAVTDEAGKRVNLFERAEAAGEQAESIEVPPEPPLTFDSLTRGKTLFNQFGCMACHGETGAGDGPAAVVSLDFWGFPLPPRDFNSGAFRGGSSGRDIYLRIAAGLPGTTMPPYSDEVMNPDDRWALTHYIRSLRRKDVEISEVLATDGRIPARGIEGAVPLEPSDPLWERIEPARLPLNPLWEEPEGAHGLSVKVLHNGRQIGFLLQWADKVPNGAPLRVEDFQDAAAIQFSLNGATPFLGMGDAENPVNIWFWKAGWQQEVDGPRPDVSTAHPSMQVDFYPEAGTLFSTALAAGNLLAAPARSSPIEVANARGFGTFEPHPAAAQNVAGRGVWRDGHWQVVFVRDLRPSGSGDVQFGLGQSVPVTFAVWDGQGGDRNGRKLISNWHQLFLAP